MKIFRNILKRIGIILISLLAIIGIRTIYCYYQFIPNLHPYFSYPTFIREAVLSQNNFLTKIFHIDPALQSTIEYIESENPNTDEYQYRFKSSGAKVINIKPGILISIPAVPQKGAGELSGYIFILNNKDISTSFVPTKAIQSLSEDETQSKIIEFRFQNAFAFPRNIYLFNPNFSREKGPYPKVREWFFGLDKTWLHGPSFKGDFCFILHNTNFLAPARNKIFPDCYKIMIINPIGEYPQTILDNRITSLDGINPATVEIIYHTIRYTPEESEVIESK